MICGKKMESSLKVKKNIHIYIYRYITCSVAMDIQFRRIISLKILDKK